MNLVLALEPDSSQEGPLATVVRAKLGAELHVVTTPSAAIVSMNERVPDVLLIGRDIPQEQRTRITHWGGCRSHSTDRRKILLAEPAAFGQFVDA